MDLSFTGPLRSVAPGSPPTEIIDWPWRWPLRDLLQKGRRSSKRQIAFATHFLPLSISSSTFNTRGNIIPTQLFIPLHRQRKRTRYASIFSARYISPNLGWRFTSRSVMVDVRGECPIRCAKVHMRSFVSSAGRLSHLRTWSGCPNGEIIPYKVRRGWNDQRSDQRPYSEY